jgi:hypothetical protein
MVTLSDPFYTSLTRILLLYCTSRGKYNDLVISKKKKTPNKVTWKMDIIFLPWCFCAIVARPGAKQSSLVSPFDRRIIIGWQVMSCPIGSSYSSVHLIHPWGEVRSRQLYEWRAWRNGWRKKLVRAGAVKRNELCAGWVHVSRAGQSAGKIKMHASEIAYTTRSTCGMSVCVSTTQR